MNKKKRFCFKAIVLISLFTITPVANGIVSNSINLCEIKNEIIQNKQQKWDLKITLSEISFQRYDQQNDIAYYKIRYNIENIGTETYIGFPKTVLRVHNEKWEISSWEWQGILPLLLCSGKNKTIDKVLKIDYENERFVSGQTVDLETGKYDISGSEDFNQSNNVGIGFGKYWESTDNDYIPSGNHLTACLPNQEWIEGYEVFYFPDKILEIPVFSEEYKRFVIPTFLSSERIGWIGDFIIHFLSSTSAFCNFSREFFDIASLLTITVGELYLLLYEVIGTISAVAKGKIIITLLLVSGLLTTLSKISETLGRLIAEIRDLPIDPNDPLRVELAESFDGFYSFLCTYPWNENITIKGEINNCKPLEEVKLSCRNVTNKNISGGPGCRVIEPFSVNSSWKLRYLDGLFFRCCQVKLDGSGHINNDLKTRRIFSYVAPGGSLNIVSGFKNLRPKIHSFLDIFDDAICGFSILKRILMLKSKGSFVCHS
jgi:hypothetical protein